MNYARARGISKRYASSGRAVFDRPFALWYEAPGIALDYLTQLDLHQGVPEGYQRILIAGHDEYWPGRCATIWRPSWRRAARWRGGKGGVQIWTFWESVLGQGVEDSR